MEQKEPEQPEEHENEEMFDGVCGADVCNSADGTDRTK